MRIEIENFAKIKSANIEINGITVIAGENNTGKSTVGKVLYSIFDSFYAINDKVVEEKRKRVQKILSDIGYFDEEEAEFYIINFEKNYDNILRDIFSLISNETSNLDKKNMVIDALISILSDYVPNDVLDRMFTKIHDVANNLYIVLTLSEDSIRKTIVNRVFNDEFNNQFLPLFETTDTPMLKLNIKDELINLSFANDIEINKYIPIQYQIVYLDNPFLLESINYNSLQKFRLNKGHALSTARKLSQLNTYSVIDETISRENVMRTRDMIEDIIHGYFIDEDSVVKFVEDGIDKPINIANLSTGIKSFATILRLLNNNYIIENSTLILDEPEVNLHPKWQMRYAELLVRMQKELDLHIILNTHSPYFINAIEVFSSKYGVAEKNKFYLAKLDGEKKAFFEDVTTKVDEIYKLLAGPLREMSDMIYGED